MKKILLLSLVMVFSASLLGQSNLNKPTMDDKTPSYIKHLIKYDQMNSQNAGAPDKTIAQSKGLQKIPFASSANIYSLISTDQSVLTVDQQLGAIAFFARAGGSYGSSGDNLRISTTTFGNTSNWDEHIVIPESGKGMRYPSGDILYFSGATSVRDCYAAFSGPITDGTGWSHNFTGSVKMDGTNEAVTYESLPGGTYFGHANSNLSVCADSTVHVAGDNYIGTSADYSWGNGLYYNGQYNASTNQFDWSTMQTMNHSFAIDSSDMDIAASSAITAWSEDGSVGYYIFLGRDSVNDPRAYQPIVYKSLDQGATWNLEPVFDFSTLTSITDYVWPTFANPNLTKAFFSYQMDPVVDHNGLLHIFGIVQGSYSDHKDSLGFTFRYEPDKIFHVYMLPGGGWDAELVKEMNTFDVTADDNIFGSGGDAMGWTHRINAVRSEDGEKLFVVWGDTDSALAAPNNDGLLINSAPDIFAWGKDLVGSTTYPVTNYTKGTMFWGDNFFHFASNIAYEDAEGNMIIPVSTADIGNTPVDPVTHSLLLDIGYGPTLGVEDSKQTAAIKVSQNYPNPFNDRTNIAVELNKSVNLSLTVYNMIGQKVFVDNRGEVKPGSYNFRVQAEELKSGIYFYRIDADDYSLTRKMIVQ